MRLMGLRSRSLCKSYSIVDSLSHSCLVIFPVWISIYIFVSILHVCVCSFMLPQIIGEFDPNTYYIELPDASDEIRLIAGTRVRAPICPQCGVEKTYKREIPGSALDVIDCDQCMYKGEAYRWNWRRQAGFGRTWINIWGVHEGEAVPGEKLMDELEKLSGFVWNYAYCGE